MREVDKERLRAALPSWDKIAVLMVALGDEVAAELMRQFDDDEAAEVAQALVGLKGVSKDVQDRVLAEFAAALEGDAAVEGGVRYARQVLERALGPERAQAMLERALDAPAAGFALLRNLDPQRAAPFIGREHPQTIALILSQLATEQAAAILECLPGAVQAEVAHRIATLGKVDSEIVRAVEENLAELLSDALDDERRVGGSEALAAILNAGGGRLEKGVLASMDNQDPEAAEAVRRRLLSFDDLARLPERDAQVLLEQIDMGDLRLALRAADKLVQDAFLGAMSERRRARFMEDVQAMAPVRMSEVQAARDRIVQAVRALEEQQLLRVPRSGEDDPYV